MAKAKRRLPKERLRVTLDDAIFITASRVYVDLFTRHGDLLLEINAADLAVLIGEIVNSIRDNPLQDRPRPRLTRAK